MSAPTLALPEDVITWIEAASGHKVLGTNRIPGGAMREGWFIDTDADNPDDASLFLRFSPRPMPEPTAFHRLSTEAEVVRALGEQGRVVARVRAVHPTREAILLSRIPGDTWFYRIKDPAEQISVAQDFIRNLAATHRLAPAELGITSLGPVMSAREHALERIAEIRRRGTSDDGSLDPLVRLSADWLERNVPDYDGPVVLVQGDTGPGNFMYQDGKVTAVVDWELCHWGDPMDDIAWLSLRTVQDTFTHLPDRLREYAELSGHEIDTHRIWYYRLFAETTMATLNQPRNREAVDADTPAKYDLGNGMLYTQLHRRLWVETLNELMALNLDKPSMPSSTVVPDWHTMYAGVLSTLKTVTPLITDPLALQWTKGVARVVRYLEQIDLDGRDYAELERTDLVRLLGHEPITLAHGRTELADANRQGTVSDEDYVRYLWNKIQRDDELMRTASGALHTRTWPPLI